MKNIIKIKDNAINISKSFKYAVTALDINNISIDNITNITKLNKTTS